MELALVIDAALPAPLHQQIYSQLRLAILSGRLRSGQRLPSSRMLAKSLSLSRTTVIQGYDQLISEGYLETRPGSGTYVCSQLPEISLEVGIVNCQHQTDVPITLSINGQRIKQAQFRTFRKSCEISFRYGQPALELFPVELWRKLLSKHCRATTQWLDYAENSLGYWHLRKALADYLQHSRAVRCTPNQVIVTNGSQQALNLITQLLVNPDDSIAIEEPGYRGARHILKASGAKLLPIPLDRDGLIVDKLSEYDVSPRLVYVTPSHQFPTGVLMSLHRRLALLQWAWRTGALIVEDDYDSEYRYGGRPIPSLQGLDSHASVLYVGTFSKVLFPSIRLGYLVLPETLVNVFGTAKWLADRQSPSLTQYALSEFIIDGHLERHIRKMRLCYAQRREALVNALHTYFGTDVEILGDSAGLHVMAKLPVSLSDDEVIARAAGVGVEICSARVHYEVPSNTGEFVFGYTLMNEAQIEEGIHRVFKALRT
ncbi:transcriptional regulator with hth domain protein and aminotransferase domain protein [Leptolyngbya sp. Heron Island J]|uniref:MocR-like pyridoxine biosynthesis transcription factor PdxR n=1 Tax=Leptolyngbya sp. Heron Island J TaxID=1385935 RepID=UPI0003B95572|nr:PLP-dependent aminotransferase family protein [Leptolyngbya sp. Heron Island J]ESA36273.1 transcriptional regulator with hth domain protein and aminotransferase domain protein [Leptolyngbya sp. Heron Island J]